RSASETDSQLTRGGPAGRPCRASAALRWAMLPALTAATARSTSGCALAARAASPVRRASRKAMNGLGNTEETPETDRKSTRLNSSHVKISYAVCCLKKKNLHYC